MAFNVTGGITITDVRDGTSAPVVLLSNENHNFMAEQNGVISGGDLTGFSTEVQVWVGLQEYTSTGNVTPTGAQFRIGTPTVSGSNAANITVNVNRTNGIITISDANTSTEGFVDGNDVNEFTISVPVTIAGLQGTATRVISIGKSIGGSAPITRIASNTQTVRYDSTGSVSRSANIVLTASFFNNDSGTVTWQYQEAGGSLQTLTAGNGVTFSTVTVANDTVTITPAAYNTLQNDSGSVSFRVTRSGQSDQITIARISDGAAAISIVIEVVSGSTILRSDTDSVVLRADVYQAGTLLSPGGDWTYAWTKDGTALTSGNQTVQTGATQQSGEGFNQRNLRVEGDGILDNGSSRFTCRVQDPS